jgi:hypothetical protein
VSTQLEKLAEVIGDALGEIGVLDTSWDEDCQVAKAVLEAGFVIPQVKLPTPVPLKREHVQILLNTVAFPETPEERERAERAIHRLVRVDLTS